MRNSGMQELLLVSSLGFSLFCCVFVNNKILRRSNSLICSLSCVWSETKANRLKREQDKSLYSPGMCTKLLYKSCVGKTSGEHAVILLPAQQTRTKSLVHSRHLLCVLSLSNPFISYDSHNDNIQLDKELVYKSIKIHQGRHSGALST